MTDILDNELVRKYFSGDAGEHSAEKVLRAMQEPIRKGELYLSALVQWDQGCQVQRFDAAITWDGFHPNALRLPDRFQATKECDAEMQTSCPKCHKQHVFIIDKSQKPYEGFKPLPAPNEECRCHEKTIPCAIGNVLACKCFCHRPPPERCNCIGATSGCCPIHDKPERCQFCGDLDNPKNEREHIHQCSDGGEGMRRVLNQKADDEALRQRNESERCDHGWMSEYGPCPQHSKPERKKCDCGLPKGDHCADECIYGGVKPSDAVEAKIREIADRFYITERELRELVELAKGEK
jgi:hypothetical protein